MTTETKKIILNVLAIIPVVLVFSFLVLIIGAIVIQEWKRILVISLIVSFIVWVVWGFGHVAELLKDQENGFKNPLDKWNNL